MAKTVAWTTKDEQTGRVFEGTTRIAETVEEAVMMFGAEFVLRHANGERIRLDKVNAKQAGKIDPEAKAARIKNDIARLAAQLGVSVEELVRQLA